MVRFIIPLFFYADLSPFVGITISLFLFTACFADPAPVIHYSPVENLEHADSTLDRSSGAQYRHRGVCANGLAGYASFD